jgi:hypothetical protein
MEKCPHVVKDLDKFEKLLKINSVWGYKPVWPMAKIRNEALIPM